MSIAGFAFDVERAHLLHSALLGAEAGARTRLNHAVGRRVSALSVKDLGNAFFAELGAPVYFRSVLTGRASLGVDAMRGYAACADPQLREAALAVLDVRRARKVRSTYIDSPLNIIGPDSRIHPGWLNYGAQSGRWSCQDPNLMNLPRADNDPTYAMGGIRSLYRAPPGKLIVSFDCSQLEMRVAAYASGDRAMIAACESSDLHGGNAKVIFGKAFDLEVYAALKKAAKLGGLNEADSATWECLDALRSLAKSAGFAVCYMANAETVYARIVASGKSDISLLAVEAMLQRLRRGFATYFAWQQARLDDAIRTGITREPITGRVRWLGHDPSPTECANHPIQGGAAGYMNTRLPVLVHAIAQQVPGSRLVAQVHDSGVFEVPEQKAARVVEIMREIMPQPIAIASSGETLYASFPIDTKIGERWS
jgi:DNA polymerase I